MSGRNAVGKRCQRRIPAIVGILVALISTATAASSRAGDPGSARRITLRDPLPYGQPPVDYDSAESNDPFARLQRDVDAGRRTLSFDQGDSYLKSLLSAVGIPESSQLLVFSKTAANVRQVSPTNPRAVYFNDDAYVGWVPGSPQLELCGLDPVKGAMFYTLSVDPDRPFQIQRQRSCLTCHVSQSTLYVPGLMIRSLVTDERGRPKSGFSGITHESPFTKRWGGWYVTGGNKSLTHLGNIFGDNLIERHRSEPELRAHLDSLAPFYDLSKHRRGTSDVLPHLVLDHQWHGQNLILRVHHEVLYDRHSDAEEQLVRYLLFLDEPQLPAPVAGDAEYRRWFESQGPCDGRGRSLRRFNLKTRLFEYRCSYLIQSQLFAALPVDVKSRIVGKISDILHGKRDESMTLPADERAAIREILAETLPDLFP